MINNFIECSYSVQCEWEKAAEYADILKRQCKWSPAAYTYQYATFNYMIMTEKNRPELRPEVDKFLKYLMIIMLN